MLKRHAQFFEGLFVISDLIVVTFSWLVSYGIRFFLGVLPIEKGIPPFREYIPMLIFVWLIWVFLFRKMGLYKPMRSQSIWKEILSLIKANTFAVILLLAATYLFKEKSVPLSRMVFLIFWVFQTFSSVFSRMTIRAVLRKLRKKGFNIRYSLVVGAGPLAQHIAASMVGNREFGIELVGFLASPQKTLGSPTENRTHLIGPMIAPIIGEYDDLAEIIERGGIDQVIIALPLEDHTYLLKVVESIGDTVIDVKLVPDVHRFIQLGSEIEEFDGVPVISLASTPLDGINRVIKRILDLFLGTFLFILFLPLMVLISLLIKLTSPGPIFYKQERLGLDGKPFPIFKFRTMHESISSEVPKFTTSSDQRVTGLGKILRRWSLDELPQLINVIRGNMSLVGPRPERPFFIDEFRKRVPKYMLRHKVQAGMTGWAQINGWRGNTSIERRIEHDLFYIENWSIGLDLKILWLTIFKGFKNRNAY
jgi:Undecaprenyl-phosphate glucose phosphotransferase